MKLVMDKREHETRRRKFQKFLSETPIGYEEGTLDVCDYVAYDGDTILFGIEYKSYSDLVSSIGNGHLKSQIIDMEGMENPYLFVVGNYHDYLSKPQYSNVSREMVIGFLTSINARYKTRVFCFETEMEAIRGIVHLFKIHSEPDKVHLQDKLPERKIRTGNPKRDMFLSLPGVGNDRCKKYMDKISFVQFITICKFDGTAKQTLKKDFGISVSDSLIEFCRQL